MDEHDINYHPQTSIKGEALADFLLEISGGGEDTNHEGKPVAGKQPKGNRRWTLYTDDAFRWEGSGAGLILTGPEWEEVMYAFRFDFHTPNNEEEYEALLTGLRLAKKLEWMQW